MRIEPLIKILPRNDSDRNSCFATTTCILCISTIFLTYMLCTSSSVAPCMQEIKLKVKVDNSEATFRCSKPRAKVTLKYLNVNSCRRPHPCWKTAAPHPTPSSEMLKSYNQGQASLAPTTYRRLWRSCEVQEWCYYRSMSALQGRKKGFTLLLNLVRLFLSDKVIVEFFETILTVNNILVTRCY